MRGELTIMTRTIDFAPKHHSYQLRGELLESFYRLVALVESSNFNSLHNNIINLLSMNEAEHIVDFIADKAGIKNLDLLTVDLQNEIGVQLNSKDILFIMLSPAGYIAEQLNIDEDTAAWLYDKLHLRIISDNLVGWMKVLLLDAEEKESIINNPILS